MFVMFGTTILLFILALIASDLLLFIAASMLLVLDVMTYIRWKKNKN